MTTKQKIAALATEKSAPCVTISLNTHRTHPDNAQDVILLKNLLKEAEERVINEFGKRPVASLLEKISGLEIDESLNLDSLHIFLSNDTQEIIKSPWKIQSNRVQVADTFNIRPLIKSLNMNEEYYILLLSQGGVSMYNATHDGITEEIKNADFPFSEIPHQVTERIKHSDSGLLDDMVREFFNDVDKAVVRVYNEYNLPCVIISTENNYSRFMQVADRPSIYHGYANIDYNNTDTHHIAKQAWEIIKSLIYDRRAEAMSEMKDAMGKGNALTDLQEIFQASMEGRGDLLIVNKDYAQAVRMTGEKTFDLVTDNTKPGVIDDVTSNIAWEVLSKNGRVFFASRDEINEVETIVLKTRY
ncbi:MAG: hypothetical protein RBS19_09520 [Bacteroidales bacterium]|nr:hypothetical protein [Bacteroidales bacterium]MDY0217182.1 hypothetical protein [Bacteroidales bacterium]